MADEKNETEQTTASNEPAAGEVKPSVKKKAAKKKVAKKAVAKKAAPKKPAADSDVAPAPAGVASGASTAPPETPVAASDSVSGKTPSQVEVEVKLRKKEPVEETYMSSDTKSPGGFWVKVIIWLVIIVACFIWIRSLAKHPAEERADAAQTSGQAVTTPTGGGVAPGEEAASRTPPFWQAMGTEPPKVGTAPASPAGDQSSASVGTPADRAAESASAASGETTAAEVAGDGETTHAPVQTAVPAAPDEAAPVRDPHAESVSRILQEFDDLRSAARAEMEAMHNLMQAERDLHEAMSAPPPAYPPAWNAPGYAPYPPPSPYAPYGHP